MIPVSSTNVPQLRICVTPQCNLNCIYCVPGGEGYGKNLTTLMSKEEIPKLVKICVDIGFTHLKFTGGEPLIRKDIVEIITATKKQQGMRELQIVTNGILLEYYAAQLKETGIDIITVSLDTTCSKDYYSIRHGDIDKVIKGLQRCKEIGLPVRINSVIMKRNMHEVNNLIDLAYNMNASLKLLDLIDMSQNAIQREQWKKDFLHFKIVKELLEERKCTFIGYEEAPGGIGAPLLEYRMSNGVQVVLKDATEGTYYADYCNSCEKFPCQDALISLRVTHDGNLKMCLQRNDNLESILKSLRCGDTNSVKKSIRYYFDILKNAKYYKNKWNPEV